MAVVSGESDKVRKSGLPMEGGENGGSKTIGLPSTNRKRGNRLPRHTRRAGCGGSPVEDATIEEGGGFPKEEGEKSRLETIEQPSTNREHGSWLPRRIAG